MKIVAIADMQGQSLSIDPSLIPLGDILLVAGDLTTWGTVQELEDCNKWLGMLPHKHKLVIGGNHDAELEETDWLGKRLFTNATYLENELVEIEGLKIYASPVSEMNEYISFRAFANNQNELCRMIPEGLDILMTHGAPYGILDKVWDGENVGSKILTHTVEQVKPKIHIFGHIHESYGTYVTRQTVYKNVALCDERNTLFYSKDRFFPKKSVLLHQPVEIQMNAKVA